MTCISSAILSAFICFSFLDDCDVLFISERIVSFFASLGHRCSTQPVKLMYSNFLGHFRNGILFYFSHQIFSRVTHDVAFRFMHVSHFSWKTWIRHAAVATCIIWHSSATLQHEGWSRNFFCKIMKCSWDFLASFNQQFTADAYFNCWQREGYANVLIDDK